MTGGENADGCVYAGLTAWAPKVICLNFSDLGYMNSSGIGLLVTLLIRIQRQKQRLVAYGLTDHYQQIFELTRLNEAIGIYDNEAAAGNCRHVDGVSARQGRFKKEATMTLHDDSSSTPRTSTDGWAKPVSKLSMGVAPTRAINLNVNGKSISPGRSKGFGRLWQKTYSVRPAGSEIAPTDLIKVWKAIPQLLARRQSLLWRPGQIPGDIGCSISAGPAVRQSPPASW